MDIYAVPILISGILCALLSAITWFLRGRENINRVFSFFTMALAFDSFSNFMWFQFGSIEHINTWMRTIFPIGILVPIGLILFFFAFTGYDKRLDDKVLGIKTKHFLIFALLVFFVAMVLSIFTQWMIKIPETPKDIWDTEMGPYGMVVMPLFAGIFFYMLAMVFKSYRMSDNKPQKRFILMLAIGAAMWVVIGYSGIVFVSVSGVVTQSFNYIGIALMAVIFFVAIVNYQSDKVHELNINLERKVEERTHHLKETQSQLIQSEKMAALGHLVAGVAHEMNTPVGAVYSTQNTLALATEKLIRTLEDEHKIKINESKKVSHILKVISDVSDVIRTSSERITSIVKRLKTFAQLDEADLQTVDFNECIENTLTLFQFHLKPGIKIRKEFDDLPAITCYPSKINQMCFQLLQNANTAIETTGEIVLRTEIQGDEINFSVSDDGRGIPSEDFKKIFDPGYTAWNLNVGTGLGLAICYQVSQYHKGHINVESEIENGSKFTFSFPFKHLV
ncbi:MAG: ATP-binding protein [Candidatus Electryonea clarkiae]|nr:ATP-binding protein [Candidatus Electryonea clarkiae]MDP8288251.1 ATP-binding protein [Candidatus Electryonea clarkiae]